MLTAFFDESLALTTCERSLPSQAVLVAHGVFSRGVRAGGGSEQNDENGFGKENGGSSQVSRNLSAREETIHMSMTTKSCQFGCVCTRKYASVPRVLCVRRSVLSSKTHDVEQTEKMLPLVKGEIEFRQHVSAVFSSMVS